MTDRDSMFERGSDVRRCGRCGVLAHSGSNFCAQCGWSLSDETREPVARLPRADEKRADDKRGAHDRAEDKGADRRRRSHPASPFERRQLTVVFCDLVDSTTLATQADPEDFNDAIEDSIASSRSRSASSAAMWRAISATAR